MRFQRHPLFARPGRFDTAEVRSSERKLLFADAGIVTMRPSDVPTYVEHGAADIEITVGRAARAGRTGGVRAAGPRLRPLQDGRGGSGGDDALGESLRRRTRARGDAPASPRGLHRPPGGDRGGQWLGGLGATGLVDGIVDLTASGRTLSENHLEVVEEIVDCTARLIANPVAHKLKAAEIDALVGEVREDS